MPESRTMNSIRQLIDNILLLDIFKCKGDIEQVRKLVLVNSISLMTITILLIIGAINYSRGSTTAVILDISAAACMLICIIILRWTGKHQIPIYFGAGIMTALFMFFFITGGPGNAGYLWYYTYPPAVLFIMGLRDGTLFNAILMIPSFIYLIIMWQDDFPLYSQDFIVRFIPSLLCLFLFSYLFEATRQKSHRQLRAKQRELEETVTALRNEEAELQKARDNLEFQVEIRTKELKQSNKELKTEIAERRKLEAQLMQSQKMEAIGTLAGGVAHDLNNILSGITSYPELLLVNLQSDSPLRRPLETIHNSGQKAAAIVQDLLTLSRRSAAVFQPVDLQEVISEYLKSAEFSKMTSFHTGVTIETCFTDPPFIISGSEIHLSKTIMNLITNSAEAMPEGGKVSIDLKKVYINKNNSHIGGLQQGRYIRLAVSDTGKGIPPDVIDRIFEPFFTTKKMGRSGTGLGMAVVWGSVQDHNGHIDVQSTPGKGTHFDLYFPASSDSAAAEISETAAALPRGNSEKILVVDDVLEQREIAAGILEEIGYSVHAVSSGESAVEYLKNFHADLLILDMTMDPGIDGLETYRRIHNFKPRQRVVAVSGYFESAKVQNLLNLSGGYYIKKPYSLESIASAVRKALSAGSYRFSDN